MDAVGPEDIVVRQGKIASSKRVGRIRADADDLVDLVLPGATEEVLGFVGGEEFAVMEMAMGVDEVARHRYIIAVNLGGSTVIFRKNKLYL